MGASRGFTGVVVAGVLASVVHALYAGSLLVQIHGIRGTRTSGAEVAVARGAVMWAWWGPAPWTPPHRGWSWDVSLLARAGSPYWFNSWTPSTPGAGVFPLWAPVAASCALLALALGRWSIGPRGVCRSCGYDCAGLPGDRCPECGTLRGECASSTSQPD
ncbi:MAG: hypothetical protein DYG92_08200 [Leptolyngbya sp. PLA1]|nr:hypothetical protein [Leptolyngbya sp. PLA1]